MYIKKQRRNYLGQEKVHILRRHFVEWLLVFVSLKMGISMEVYSGGKGASESLITLSI